MYVLYNIVLVTKNSVDIEITNLGNSIFGYFWAHVHIYCMYSPKLL